MIIKLYKTMLLHLIALLAAEVFTRDAVQN